MKQPSGILYPSTKVEIQPCAQAIEHFDIGLLSTRVEIQPCAQAFDTSNTKAASTRVEIQPCAQAAREHYLPAMIYQSRNSTMCPGALCLPQLAIESTRVEIQPCAQAETFVEPDASSTRVEIQPCAQAKWGNDPERSIYQSRNSTMCPGTPNQATTKQYLPE